MPTVRFRACHTGQADTPGGGTASARGGPGDRADGVEHLRRDAHKRDLGVLDVGDQAAVATVWRRTVRSSMSARVAHGNP